MEYNLPHAVLAFLQEEDTPSLPKSYFISSSTKSTKITLIYTRRKRNETRKTASNTKKSKSNFHNDNIKARHSGRYSSSSTDDYTQRPHSVQPDRYSEAGNHRNHEHRICASTPGRGYNEVARAREIQRSRGTAKMATDPVVRHSPSKDHLSFSHFTADSGNHADSDSDVSYHYAPLSPSSVFSDKPPTPGRDFNPSNSPRPPTPNASNYASLMASTISDRLHPSSRSHHTPSRQPIGECDADISPPPTPYIRRSNESASNHSKRRGTGNTANHAETSSVAKQQPMITIHCPSPETMSSLPNSRSNHAAGHARPSYNRTKSCDTGKR